MRIFFFELKKCFTKRSVIIVFVLFLALNGFKIVSLNEKSEDFFGYAEGKLLLKEEVSGEITYEKLAYVIEKKSELEKLVNERSYSTEFDENTYTGYQYGDYGIFKEVYEDLDYAYHYSEKLEDVLIKAKNNLLLYPENSSEYRFNERVIKLYSGRKITSYYNTEGYEKYFSYDFSVLLLLLLLVFAVSPVFSHEDETGMSTLLVSSPNGNRQTARAKLLSTLSFASVVSVAFAGFDFLCFAAVFGLKGLNNPLYSVKSFVYTPLNITIGQYILISALLKIAGSVLFCLGFLLFSKAVKKSAISILFAMGFTVLNALLNDFAFEGLKLFLPVSLFIPRTYFKTADVLHNGFLCIPVFLIFAALIVIAIQKTGKKGDGI